MEKLLSKLTPEEISTFLKEVEDALKRGYSLGYSDAIQTANGRPQTSSAEKASKYHIEQVKERYNIN
jgi:hypothetical protein